MAVPTESELIKSGLNIQFIQDWVNTLSGYVSTPDGIVVPVINQALNDMTRPDVWGSSYLNMANHSLVTTLHGLLSMGKLNMAIMGDSLHAGIGTDDAGEGPYGQLNSPSHAGVYGDLWYSLYLADRNSIRLADIHKNPHYRVRDRQNGVNAGPYPQLDFRVSDNPTTYMSVVQHSFENSQFFSVYVQTRSERAAPTFDITISNDVDYTDILFTGTIDTYVDKETFNDTDYNVDGRIEKFTFDLGIIPDDRLYIKIGNITLENRPDEIVVQPGDDGTVAIVGMCFGEGFELHNWAVSSSTLKNDSDANITRGITTAERFGIAKANGVNFFKISIGTNDSKPGVSSEPEFENNLHALITDLRAYNPKVGIMFTTAPTGEIGSIYENNVAYNAIIRKVCTDRYCLLEDVQLTTDSLPPEAISDFIHPSREGYKAIAGALSRGFDLQDNTKSFIQFDDKMTSIGGFEIIPTSTNTTSTYQEIYSTTVNRPYYSELVNVTFSLNLAATTDIDDAEFIVEIMGFDGPNAQGAATVWVEKLHVTTNDSLVGSTAKDLLTISINHKITQKGSYIVRLSGKKFRLINSGGNSTLGWKF